MLVSTTPKAHACVLFPAAAQEATKAEKRKSHRTHNQIPLAIHCGLSFHAPQRSPPAKKKPKIWKLDVVCTRPFCSGRKVGLSKLGCDCSGPSATPVQTRAISPPDCTVDAS